MPRQHHPLPLGRVAALSLCLLGAALPGGRAAPPTFSQVAALAATEGTAGPTVVGNFITAVVDGDAGGDGFTGTAADALIVNFMPNALFFATPPALSLTRTACDPLPGCALSLTYELAPFASGTVTFQVQVTDGAGEVGALATTTLTVGEVNNPAQPALATSGGSAGNPIAAKENAGAQAGVALLAAPIPPGPPQTVGAAPPFNGEAAQTIASVSCVAADRTLFEAGAGPSVDPATGQLGYTPRRGRVGTTRVDCVVKDSADDPAAVSDDASFTFFIEITAGQDCAEGQAGAAACGGTEQTCFDDGMPDGDNTLNGNFVCVCNNGGQRASRQAAPTCDDCAPGSAGAAFCGDAFMPPRWFCVDTDPSPSAQGGFTCNCSNGGGQGTTPAACDDCAPGALGDVTCAPTGSCVDPDRGDPSQQGVFQCVCRNGANAAMPSANAAPGAGECDDCAVQPCGQGQTCNDPDGGDPLQQGSHVCSCANSGGVSVGQPAASCDDCAGNPMACGAGQTCRDPDPSPGSQGDHLCECANGGGAGVGAPATSCDDCIPNPCGAAGTQICADPNPNPASQLDHTCTCNTGIAYPAGSGVATGTAAVCPIPPLFTAGPSVVRLKEDLTEVFLNGVWAAGPGLAAGYSAQWASGVSDGEGPGRADSGTQARGFNLTYVSGSVAEAALFAAGMSPSVDPAGRLSLMLRPDAFGSVTYSVALLDSGLPTGVAPPASGALLCPGRDVWCISGDATLTISVDPVDDPPTFNCTNTSIVVDEDSGPATLSGWALNISAGPSEPLQSLEFRVFTDNPGLFASQPFVDYTPGSSAGDLKFTPLPGAEGVAEVEVQLWDSARRAVVSRCSLLRVEVRNVNDRPVFSNRGEVTLVEDAGMSVVEGWASGIRAGEWAGSRGDQARNEQDRRVFFSVNFTDPADRLRFVSPPFINPVSGDLHLHPAPDQNTHGGPVVLNVTLVDSAGLRSEPFLLQLFILPVDDPPLFTPGPARVVVHEDAPRYSEVWATSVAPGPLFEGAGDGPRYENQSVFFTAELSQGDRVLFKSGYPVVLPNGTLEFELAADQYGVAAVTVTAFDTDPATGIPVEGSKAVVVIDVLPVNDPPFFSVFEETVRVEKGGPPQSLGKFFNHIGAGPDNEQVAESVAFDVLTNDTSLFAAGGLPRVTYHGGSSAGLEFQPAADRTGVARVTIRAVDNGGTGRNGSDTFLRTILIVVTNVNNPPSFVRGVDLVVREDECNYPVPCNFSNWATRVTPGEGEMLLQDAAFLMRPSNDRIFMAELLPQFLTIPPFFVPGARPLEITGFNSTLHAQFVNVSRAGPYELPGRLAIFTRPNASGASLVSATLVDDGERGTLPVKSSDPQTFTVRVLAVNDPPSFTAGPQVILDECAPGDVPLGRCRYVYPGWAKAISPGPPDESGQRVLFTVETNRPEVFKTPPTIDGVTGTLSFELNPLANTGGAPVALQVTACDTGGTLNGGVDCTRSAFNLSIGAVDSPARFLPGEDLTVLEDEGLVRRLGWASNPSLGRTGGVPNTGFRVVPCMLDDPSLLASGPNVSLPEGDLVLVTAPDRHGTTVATCVFGEGAQASRVQFALTVLPVNDRPSFGLRNLTVPLTNYTSVSGGSVLIEATGGNLSSEATLGLWDPNLFWARGVLASDVAAVPFPGVVPGTNLVPGPSGSYGVVSQFSANYVISGRDIVVLENWDGQHPGYVVRYLEPTSIRVGPPDESLEQTHRFEVSCGRSDAFSRAPSVATSGVLAFSLRPLQSGIIPCSITMADTGGTARGGVPRSTPLDFSIIIIDVDSPPQYTRGPNIVVYEDHPLYRQAWASAISPGGSPGEAAQQVEMYVNISEAQAGLFSTAPMFEPWPTPGVLTFQAGRDQFGVVSAVVTAADSAGARGAASSLQITVLPVNDAPLFTLTSQRISVMEDSPTYNALFATQISPGAPNEFEQEMRWEITPVGTPSRTSFSIPPGEQTQTGRDAEAAAAPGTTLSPPAGSGVFSTTLFFEEPRVLSPGALGGAFSARDVAGVAGHNLTFRLASNAWGTQELRLCLSDSGGVQNAGVDRTCQTFFVDVVSVNDPPVPVTSGPIEVYEDSGAVVIPRWLSMLTAGPANEGVGAVKVLGTTCPSSPSGSLFASPPLIAFPPGDVSFHVAPDAFGSVNCTVSAQDSAGAVAHIPLRIVVTPVNDPPSFTPLTDTVTWKEDGGPYRRLYGANLSPGPRNEAAQRVFFGLQPVSGRLPQQQAQQAPGASAVPQQDLALVHGALFDEGGPLQLVQSSVDPTQAYLSFTPKKDAYGEITLDIVVLDDASVGLYNGSAGGGAFFTPGSSAMLGGTAPSWTPAVGGGGGGGGAGSGVRTVRLTINILPVNDPPGFEFIRDILLLEEDRAGVADGVVVVVEGGGSAGAPGSSSPRGSAVVPGWAAAASPGPPNEASQGIAFVVLWPVENSEMFFAPPAVQHPSGDLTLPLRPDAFGTINLRVKAVDTGGRDNGGFDESSEKLLRVTVSPINDPPYVVYGSNTKGNTLRILEDTPDTISAFVKEFHPGPREEGLQTVSVVSSGAYSSGLIDTLQVFSDGAVSIIPKKDQNGFSFGWIEIQDSGGVANGGSDRSTVNISVEVVPVNDPPSLTLAKSHVTVDEDCGIATIADVIFDVTPGPPDESGQQIFYRVTVDTPELFVALPEISPAGVLRFSAAPDYSGEIPAKIQACDDGGNANGGTPCSTMSDFTFRISPVNDRPSFVPGTPVITVSNNIGAYTAQWAMQVSGGPLDEAQDELAFIVTRVSDASLFLDGGAPSVAPDGVLSFQANSQRAGNATVWIALRDKEGARSPEYVLRVETTDPSEAPLVAVLDQLYDEFSILGFKQAVARAVSVPTECITVIRTQPATVRVNFRFNRGCGGVTAASLNRQYMAAIADESSQLRTDLRLVESYSEGTRSTQLNLDNLDRTNTNLVRLPNGEYTTRDSGASTGASQSVLIILLVLLGVAMLAGAVLLFWCLKRFRRRSRRQEGQAEAERHAAEQQAYDERGWESHAAVEHVEADPDLLPPEGLPAPRAYHEGSPGGEGGVGSLGSSGGSAVSHISNTHYLTAVPTDPSLDGGGAGSSDAGSANPIDLAFGAAPQRRRGSAASAVQHQQQRHSVRFDLRPPINPLLQDNSPAAAASGHPTRPLGVQAAGLAEPGRAEAAGWKARQQPQRDTQGGQIQGLAPHRALRYGGVADADGDDAAAAAAAPALSADRLRLVMGLRGGGEGGGGVAGHRRAPSDLSSRVSGGGASEEEIVVG